MDDSDMTLWSELKGANLNTADAGYDVTFVSDAVMRVITKAGAERFHDYLVNAFEAGVFNQEKTSLLLRVASWSSDEAGAKIQSEAERWLEAGVDEGRVGLALSLDTIPFRSRARRIEALTRIARRFPRFAARCEYLMKAPAD